MCCLRILELSQHLDHPKCRSVDQDLVGPRAHFPPNVSVPTSKYLEHKCNLLVIIDTYAIPFFHYFRPIDGVFMCGFYSLSTVNNRPADMFATGKEKSKAFVAFEDMHLLLNYRCLDVQLIIIWCL